MGMTTQTHTTPSQLRAALRWTDCIQKSAVGAGDVVTFHRLTQYAEAGVLTLAAQAHAGTLGRLTGIAIVTVSRRGRVRGDWEVKR